MLVLSREVGESVVIEDVVVTLIRLDANYAEISLRKQTGGKPQIVTLTKGQRMEACYGTIIGLVKSDATRARLTIQSPEGISIHRLEFMDGDT